ncbi:universal stress protein UspE [Alginatibacterium sediminis]|uniref:Universal stress protein UspE n=1 Tax=Alginatibacterium sediminis TaxID=2164068 RepID=A0A420EH60_9ALTE|nr:universal stress protein UspE [Alginatibacterium sediminis]RKF20029.1 universal stress protein UspE [Alginatibacterium sediminis]
MTKYRNILVVIDPTLDEQPALIRALALAQRKDDVRIKAFLTIYDFSYEMTSMLSIDEREAMRSAVINERNIWLKDQVSAASQSSKIECKVVWHNRLFEAIINEVLDFGHDLVVKATHDHPKLKSVIFTPTDWHLLRKCPSPLLLVKHHDWPENGKILAAVDATTEDEEHLRLNERVILEATQLAELLDAPLHLVNAYPAAPINIAIELPDFDPYKYNASVREHHLKQLATFVETHQLQGCRTHVLEGMADDVIPDVANDINAELVILGTSGRTGLSAALIGNTAEHIIDSLDCDLLALKPSNYISPLDDSLS